MAREDSPYIVGDYWLDKRRDGKAPDIWQIARNDRRSIIYRSTRKRELGDAKRVIDAFYTRELARAHQRTDEAQIIPLLVIYWEEHGRTVESPDQIASSIRQIIGFLKQDEAGVGATVDQLGLAFVRRFIAWRSAPHEYSVEWAGKTYDHKSEGVKGESIQRNIEDLRAGIMHHVNMSRLDNAPKIPSVPENMRSQPRSRVLSYEELGAMLGYARLHSRDLFNHLALMLGTGVRPEAALQFQPEQYDAEFGFIDLHPIGKKRTKKRNAIVPVIEPLKPIIEGWATKPANSRKTAWRTMRHVLDLSDDVVGNTIRHTVATRLRADPKCPNDLIDDLLGHDIATARITRGYAKYDPAYMGPVRVALTRIFSKAMAAADKWAADHSLTTPVRGAKLELVRKRKKG